MGSVLNHVLLHQTVIGLEVKKQFEKLDVKPDMLVGNIGGGSNYGGFCLPFMGDKLTKKLPDRLCGLRVERRPTHDPGQVHLRLWGHRWDDPALKMYTLGKDYKTPADPRRRASDITRWPR